MANQETHKMTEQVVFFCKYCSESVAISWPLGGEYVEFLRLLCGKWNSLNIDNVSIVYTIPAHERCLLRNEDEFIGMIDLISAFSLKAVIINVSMPSKDIDDQDTIFNNNCRFDIDEDDVTDEPSSNRLLLSSAWAYSIKDIGQKFVGGVNDFRDSLRKYSIKIGFEFYFDRNNSRMVSAYCKKKEIDDCKWEIQATLSSVDGCFAIRKLFNEHSHITMNINNCKRLSCKVIAGLIKEKAMEKPSMTANDVVTDMKKDYGYVISYAKAWQALNLANDSNRGDLSKSYKELQWYTDAILSTNPGSHVVLDVDDETKRFRRLFVSFGACIHGFAFCRPMLFIDGTHLKGKYKGTLLSATGKNGNDELYPLAFAIVDAENLENWYWFLAELSNILGNSRQLTFVSDRHVGLLEALPRAFPNANHYFCLYHLKENLRSKFSGSVFAVGRREHVVRLFSDCAYASSVALFKLKMDELLAAGGDIIKRFLEDFPVKSWAIAYSGGFRYGEMSSNVAESYNSWILIERVLPITRIVDSIRTKLMLWFCERKSKSDRWNGSLCKKMAKKLQGHIDDSCTWQVKMSQTGVFEVYSYPSHRVNLTSRMCTCGKWQQVGFPCAHAVACVTSFNLRFEDYIEHYFYVSTYRLL